MASCVISGMIGFSLGVLLQRMSIHKALGNMPPTICDCCVWKKSGGPYGQDHPREARARRPDSDHRPAGDGGEVCECVRGGTRP